MKRTKKTTVITVSLDKEVKESLDQLSFELDLTISKLSRNLIYVTLEDYKLLNTVGIAQYIYAFRSSCASIVQSDQVENSASTSVDNNVQISVIIDVDVKEILEKYAGKLEVTLKQFARNLIYIGMKDLKILKKVGILRLSVAFDQFIRGFLEFK